MLSSSDHGHDPEGCFAPGFLLRLSSSWLDLASSSSSSSSMSPQRCRRSVGALVVVSGGPFLLLLLLATVIILVVVLLFIPLEDFPSLRNPYPHPHSW